REVQDIPRAGSDYVVPARRRITRRCSGPSRRVSFLWFESRHRAGSATDRHYVIPPVCTGGQLIRGQSNVHDTGGAELSSSLQFASRVDGIRGGGGRRGLGGLAGRPARVPAIRSLPRP